MSFGGGAYTLHINQNIPMKDAINIENAFKELHEGMYIWGEDNFNRAVKTGYIESADGWKLALPRYDKYNSLQEMVKSITKEQWQQYKIGKLESKSLQEATEKKETYTILNKKEYEFYKSKRFDVSSFFRLQGEYKRLSLNNPIQSSAAHMTKYATLLIFDWIMGNNYQNIIKIVNIVHDEAVIECPEELKDIAVKAVETCMIKAGNHYLEDLEIKAEAHYGPDWYSAKG